MKTLSIAFSLLLLAGCAKTVDLTVTNPTKLMHTVSVETRGESGITGNTMALGNLAPDNSKESEFKVKPGESFEVTTAIPGDGIDYREKRTVTKSDPDTLKYTVTIKPIGNPITEVNIDEIRNRLKNLQQGYGLPALGVANALDTMFGALIVLTPSKDQQNARVHMIITPVELGNAMTLKEFQYLDDSESLSLDITTSSAQKLSANFAIYGGFTFSGDAEDVYKLSSDLEGFGQYAKVEKPGFDLSKQLSADQKRELSVALQDNPGSKLCYINVMWAIKRGATEVYKGVKLSATDNVTAASIITANGAFNFSNVADQKSNYNEIALEFWGEELSPSLVSGLKAAKMLKAAGKPKIIRLNKDIMRQAIKPIAE
jgi:hypothetical protein